MKKVIAVFISISFIVGCGNTNSKTSSGEKKDTSAVRDTNINTNTEYNPAAPPISNSQY